MNTQQEPDGPHNVQEQSAPKDVTPHSTESQPLAPQQQAELEKFLAQQRRAMGFT